MRLIVMGQQAFGKDVLAKLLDTGTDEVVAVYCEPDKEGKPIDPIKEFALEKGLPVEQPANFDAEETLETLKGYNADLMVMGAFGYNGLQRILDLGRTTQKMVTAAPIPLLVQS